MKKSITGRRLTPAEFMAEAAKTAPRIGCSFCDGTQPKSFMQMSLSELAAGADLPEHDSESAQELARIMRQSHVAQSMFAVMVGASTSR